MIISILVKTKKLFKSKKAFTLVELLVVIAIIGILATLAVVALQQARSRARDSKRIADIKQAQTALELFFNEQGRYPTLEEWNSGTLITSSGEKLMINLPIAPYPADGSCTSNQNDFYYTPSSDYSTYNLSFCLGKDVSNLSDGPKCATPGGIFNQDCSSESGENNGNGNGNSNSCYPDCNAGYICQNGSCVVDPFVCGQNIAYNGYTYPTVAIGDQCWFKENLRTGKFSSSENIRYVSNGYVPWRNLSESTYGFYNDDSSLADAYGYLYSGYAAIDPRGLCPSGWRVPSRDDFYSLLSNISPEKALKLHSCKMINSPLGGVCVSDNHPRWSNSSYYYSDDSFGFSATPGGRVMGGAGANFSSLGSEGYFWTTGLYDSNRLFYFPFVLNSEGHNYASNSYNWINGGAYIRCIKKNDPGTKTVPSLSTSGVTNITANKATSGGVVSSNGGANVYSVGIVWSENNNPTIGASDSFIANSPFNNNSFTSEIKFLKAGRTYYIRAYAVNEIGIGYGNLVSFTSADPCSGVRYVDYDGYEYETVGIGNQCWFRENLRTSKFKNNNNIKNISGGYTPWRNIKEPAYGIYNDDSSLGEAYGNIYSGYTVIDPRGVCPSGWRVPSKDDFISLINSINPLSALSLHSCKMIDSPLGGSCLSDSHPRWVNSANYYGDDKFDFSVTPGGYVMGGTGANFGYLGSQGIFWTASSYDEGRIFYFSFTQGADGYVYPYNTYNFLNGGAYIRCIKEGGLSATVPVLTTSDATSISANKAVLGGVISSNGGSDVYSVGIVWSENNQPSIGSSDSNFSTQGFKNNSFSINLNYLQSGKTYYARAYAINGVGTAYGNTISFTTTDPCLGLNSLEYNSYNYQLVGIKDKCWLKENLKTDKFKNGDSIPNVTGSWSSLSAPAWAYYNDNSAYNNSYGKLYSGHVVVDSRGICPEGFKVPSRQDYLDLISYVSPDPIFVLHSCRMTNSPLGGSCSVSEHPYWNYSASYYGTDKYGFSMLPGGWKLTNWFENIGMSYLWTSTPISGKLYYIQSYNTASSGIMDYNSYSYNVGIYIRCIKE